MLKRICLLILVFGLLAGMIACAPANNEAPDNTPIPTDARDTLVSNDPASNPTPAPTLHILNDEFFKIDKTLDENSKFPGAVIEMVTQECELGSKYMLTAALSVTTEDGKRFDCDYGQIWDDQPCNINVVEMDDGILIAFDFELAHGQLNSMVLAWFDGETLEFIEWPFSDLGFYNWMTLEYYRRTFEDEPKPLFDFAWTGDTSFNLTCNLDGETKHYEVDTEYYDSILTEKYADFDRDENPPEIKELFLKDPDKDGNIEIEARLTYGEHLLIAVNAYITLQFDPDTCSLNLKGIDYKIEGDSEAEEYALREIDG